MEFSIAFAILAATICMFVIKKATKLLRTVVLVISSVLYGIALGLPLPLAAFGGLQAGLVLSKGFVNELPVSANIITAFVAVTALALNHFHINIVSMIMEVFQ